MRNIAVGTVTQLNSKSKNLMAVLRHTGFHLLLSIPILGHCGMRQHPEQC